MKNPPDTSSDDELVFHTLGTDVDHAFEIEGDDVISDDYGENEDQT